MILKVSLIFYNYIMIYLSDSSLVNENYVEKQKNRDNLIITGVDLIETELQQNSNLLEFLLCT